MKNLFRRNANVIKWTALTVAIIAFALRIYIGETQEFTFFRATGEERYVGSTTSYVLVGVLIISLLVFAAASLNSKSDDTKE